MPRKKKEAGAAVPVSVRILRSGVFPFADVKKGAGDVVEGVSPEIAQILIGRGHAESV